MSASTLSYSADHSTDPTPIELRMVQRALRILQLACAVYALGLRIHWGSRMPPHHFDRILGAAAHTADQWATALGLLGIPLFLLTLLFSPGA